jgi:hypothetical protein
LSKDKQSAKSRDFTQAKGLAQSKEDEKASEPETPLAA